MNNKFYSTYLNKYLDINDVMKIGHHCLSKHVSKQVMAEHYDEMVSATNLGISIALNRYKTKLKEVENVEDLECDIISMIHSEVKNKVLEEYTLYANNIQISIGPKVLSEASKLTNMIMYHNLPLPKDDKDINKYLDLGGFVRQRHVGINRNSYDTLMHAVNIYKTVDTDSDEVIAPFSTTDDMKSRYDVFFKILKKSKLNSRNKDIILQRFNV